MGRCVQKKHLPYLEILATPGLKKSIRCALLNSRSLIRCISECSLNLLKGNIPLTTKQKKILRKYKTIIINLINKKLSSKQKGKTLRTQKGGTLLPLLIGPVIGILSNLLL